MPNSAKPFSVKLKDFFRVGKGEKYPRPHEDELVLRPEVLEELGREQNTGNRLRVVRELQSQVREQRLQEHGVELLWYKVQDLLDPTSQELVTRHQVFDFLCDLVMGQYGTPLDMMRPSLFKFLAEHQVLEDLEKKVTLLAALTDTGKDIVHIEEKMGPFLLQLLDVLMEGEAVSARMELLNIFSNMVKFNSAYLDQGVVVLLITRLSILSCTSTMDTEILSCLDSLKCIVMYSYVPPEALVPFISCVCRVVNLSTLSGEAWDTMRKLMGTHLGHSALYNLRNIVSSPINMSDTALVRGAVFFIGQSLWGSQRIPSLKYSAMSVLPVFITALESPHQLVLFEVAVQVERLVTSQGESLTAPSWEEAVSVLELLVTRLERCTEGSMRDLVHQHLQSTIGQLEVLALNDRYAGSRTRLYGLVESVSELCPEPSVLHLLDFLQGTHLHPARAGWVARLAGVMERFYTRDTRRGVRLRVLRVLQEVVTSNMRLHEDLLVDQCVLPFLLGLEWEGDREVRVRGVHTLALLASKAQGAHLGDMIGALEMICSKFGEGPGANTDTAVLYTREDFDYQLEAILGLINCFKVKFYQQGLVARRCYYILVTVLDQIYDRPAVAEHTGEVRLEIFRTLLSLRANSDYHLGLPGSGTSYNFSPCLVCERQAEEGGTGGVTVLSLTKACMAVMRCLREETDWAVLSLVLEQIPSCLQNKGMITRYGKQVSRFASVLCSLFSPSQPLPSLNTPAKFGRPEFRLSVYPVLAALASYNRSLDQGLQKKLIQCFEYGLLTSKCNQVCIVALTALILEMSGSMYTLLPEVLLNLSKISATVHIAIPMLEFLSTLISLPKVFSSFNSEQFLSVFAITLPYTNPFKFNHYTVSLAHHVIISWFLKCRLASRNDFVKFIIRGLASNVLQPFEEGNFRKVEGASLSSLNQDSSNRQRSSSLKEESGSNRRHRHMTGVTSRPTLNRLSGVDEKKALLTFHQELTETCVDLMARYSFSNVGVQPKRSPLVDFLLSKGQTCSWLTGNMIVTITVSGCAQDSGRSGMCDSCYTSCRPQPDQEISDPSIKKRHLSEQSVRVRRGPGLVVEDSLAPLVGGETKPVNQCCGCWCSGWSEVMVRRPSGVTAWVCRVENGLLSGLPQSEVDSSLRDITTLLKPGQPFSEPGQVQGVKEAPRTTRLELDLASHSKSCQPIIEQEEEEVGPIPGPRARAATISSTSSPVKGRQGPSSINQSWSQQDRGTGAGISPQFMFLQLYQGAGLPTSYSEKPLLLPQTKSIESSLNVLDRIFCTETHKVGVLYVGPGQEGDEKAILSNQFGSTRYAAFLSGLGSLVDTNTTDPRTVFMGGLDPRSDGQFAYIWQDDAMQVVYHVATLMPNQDKDPQRNKKKMHIGNDYVAIVYNDSGQPYVMGTVKGQFIYAVILVEPLDFESNRMSVVCKKELQSELGHLASPRIVSDQNLSRLTRQTALHCNLAAVIFSQSQRSKDPYASNWLERLRHIKRFKGKVLKEQQEEESSGLIHDFTGYV